MGESRQEGRPASGILEGNSGDTSFIGGRQPVLQSRIGNGSHGPSLYS